MPSKASESASSSVATRIGWHVMVQSFSSESSPLSLWSATPRIEVPVVPTLRACRSLTVRSTNRRRHRKATAPAYRIGLNELGVTRNGANRRRTAKVVESRTLNRATHRYSPGPSTELTRGFAGPEVTGSRPVPIAAVAHWTSRSLLVAGEARAENASLRQIQGGSPKLENRREKARHRPCWRSTSSANSESAAVPVPRTIPSPHDRSTSWPTSCCTPASPKPGNTSRSSSGRTPMRPRPARICDASCITSEACSVTSRPSWWSHMP